jgi:hypothetical protein
MSGPAVEPHGAGLRVTAARDTLLGSFPVSGTASATRRPLPVPEHADPASRLSSRRIRPSVRPPRRDSHPASARPARCERSTASSPSRVRREAPLPAPPGLPVDSVDGSGVGRRGPRPGASPTHSL